MIIELKHSELKKDYSEISAFPGEAPGLTGQNRAAEALSFGLRVKADGYNIYVSGQPGCGKTTFSARFAEEAASGEAAPPDLLYACNFADPKEPRLIKVSPGKGRELKADLEEFCACLMSELPKIFSDKDFEGRKAAVVKLYAQKREDSLSEIKKEARKQGFGVRVAQNGVYFMPLVDGEMLSEEQFDQLSEDEQARISANSEVIQDAAAQTLREIKGFERDSRKAVEDIEYAAALMLVGRQAGRLIEKYRDEPGALEYVSLIKEDILDNIADFQNDQEPESDELSSVLPWAAKKPKEELTEKYAVNIIADNGGLSGAPVVVGVTPTYASVIGDIEYDSEYGGVTTDFMKIRPGLLHKANGGYLILQAQDVFTQPHLWDGLRKALKTGEITIEQPREYGTGVNVATLKPQNAKLSVKLILTGSPVFYDMMEEYDEDFQKLFKIHAEFDSEMDANAENIEKAAAFAANCSPGASFERGAVARILEYCARLSERQNKLSARFGKIKDIATEAAALSASKNESAVTAETVREAIKARGRRLNLYEEKLSEMIEDGIIIIDTEGGKVGQVNGLAVIDGGEYAFAKPSRITATTYAGQAGVVNIEEEAEMSGAIHTKGVQVLIGYLGQHYAQRFPLSLSSRVCFEQNYSGIDGDSASSAELYAILSSLADAPVDQGIAVTGSMNQRGEIQPVGGVTQKVEGFFDVCQKRGLNGRQGVLIPERNRLDLQLDDRVIHAVANGAFHIYAADSIDDGIELLTGTPAREIHARAAAKLRAYFRAGAWAGRKR
jgi:predicted ATP-dependent protease